MRTTLLCALVVVAGCASGGAARPAIHYAGEPFELTSRDGRISGQVCGMDLDVDVRRHGDDSVTLSGFLDGQFPVQLTARADGGAHTIAGALGSAAGEAAVELRLSPDALDGRVGFRRFALHGDGESLVGTMQIPDAVDPSDVTVEGRAQLASLPIEAQAAIVPALLSCNVQPVGKWGKSALELRVGGAAGALPHQSSSLYTHD